MTNKKGVRRAYIEDSFVSQRSSPFNEHSFLSEDKSSSELSSFYSCESDVAASSSRPHFADDESVKSFVIQDSFDHSFTSKDSSVQMLDSPAPPPRKQPSRFTKADLNAPNSRLSESRSTAKPTSFSKKELRSDVANSSVLASVTDPDERKLLLELYPELAEDEQTCEQKSFEQNEEKEEESDEERKPSPTLFSSILAPDTSDNSERNSSLDDDDSFERYLQLLKGNDNKKNCTHKENVPSEKSFLVSDSESILDESSDFDDDEEYDDEEEESESGKENEPVKVLKETDVKKHLADLLRKEFDSPSVKRRTKKDDNIDNDDHFLASLSANFNGIRHRDAVKFANSGIKTKRLREDLTDRVFEIFTRRCFDGQIPLERSSVVWSGRLLTTAGRCKNHIMKGTSTIELSLKVCTTPERLRDTLIHEMCHAATWLIDKLTKAGHGPAWQQWTYMCRKRCPSLPPIGRCHSYHIDKKFIYECSGCGQKIGRHSKSIDLNRLRCGKCHGKFILMKNGQPVDEQQRTNKFAMFVKEHYGKYKAEGVKHSEVMKIISEKWKQERDQNANEISADEATVDISVLSIHD